MEAVIIGAIADSIIDTVISNWFSPKTIRYNKKKKAGMMNSLKNKPKAKNDQCLLLVSIFNCNPTATKATGVTVFPIFKKELCNEFGKSNDKIVHKIAMEKAIKGGNLRIFIRISEVFKLPLEKLAATKIPNVVTTTNEPG